jgi:hypothetical protein
MVKYLVRTAFGDSTMFFGGMRALSSFQGGCQGNEGGPAMWLVVSSRLVRLMHTRGLITRMHPGSYVSCTTSVNINASYIEALLCKQLIRSKIYFLRTILLNQLSDISKKYVFLTS